MLILVRHGQTAHNASGRLLGRLDLPLNDFGRVQSAALGKVALLSQAVRVVSSPLARTYSTASALGPDITIDDRWMEIDYGVYDGMALADVPAELWQEWARDPEWTPEGGESLADVGRRVRAACDDLWVEAADSDVVVVSHVTPIKAAVAWALGVGDAATWRMYLETASVCQIGKGRAGPALRTFNETHYRPSS